MSCGRLEVLLTFADYVTQSWYERQMHRGHTGCLACRTRLETSAAAVDYAVLVGPVQYFAAEEHVQPKCSPIWASFFARIRQHQTECALPLPSGVFFATRHLCFFASTSFFGSRCAVTCCASYTCLRLQSRLCVVFNQSTPSLLLRVALSFQPTLLLRC